MKTDFSCAELCVELCESINQIIKLVAFEPNCWGFILSRTELLMLIVIAAYFKIQGVAQNSTETFF